MKKLSAKLLMALLLISFTTTTISAADWGLFELKGKVKSVTYKKNSYYDSPCPYRWHDAKGNEVYVVSFSKEGKVIPSNGNKITRNKRGHITHIECLCEDPYEGGTMWMYQKVARDSKERVTIITSQGYECGWQTKFYYNSNGDINKSTVEEYCNSDGITTYTYTYESYDDYGNWTKRTKKGDNGENITQTREITYHDGARKVKLSLITEASAHDSTATIAKVESVVIDTTAKDTTAKADTVATKTTTQKKSAATIVSGDLALFDLKGNVKSVTYNENNANPIEWVYWRNDQTPNPNSVSFTNDGKLITPNASTESSVQINRDKKDNITSIKVTHLSTDDSFKYNIDYNSKGRLTILEKDDNLRNIDSWTYKYYYNSNGLINKCTLKGFDYDGNETSSTSTYSYDSFDEYGNWTKRTVKTGDYKQIETREITYYDPSEVKASATAKKSNNTSKGTHTKSPVAAKDLKTAKDWGLFDVYGKVKSVTYYNGSCPFGQYDNETVTVKFSKDAKVTSTSPKKAKITRNPRNHATGMDFRYNYTKIRRDSKERLTSYEMGGYEFFATDKFKFNKAIKSIFKGEHNILQEKTFLSQTNYIIYHNKEQIKTIFYTAFDINVDLSCLDYEIDIRQDIVHRVGYNKKGDNVQITKDDILALNDKIDKLVEDITLKIKQRKK